MAMAGYEISLAASEPKILLSITILVFWEAFLTGC